MSEHHRIPNFTVPQPHSLASSFTAYPSAPLSPGVPLPLPPTSGCLLGKGGNIVRSIRDASGVSIRILAADNTPACACAGLDRVVQCAPASV